MSNKKQIKNIFPAIDYAIKTKRYVGGMGKLKKDGTIVKLNGQVFERKTTKDGEEIILMDNFLARPRKGTTKRWQIVLVRNIVSFNENKWLHTKKGE